MSALIALDDAALAALVKECGQPAFRAKQLREYALKGVPVEKMSSLPKPMREKLVADGVASLAVSVVQKRTSAVDGTTKFLFALEDGNVVEGVLMRYEYGSSVCVSTQVGCAMGCKFCASTLDGKIRDLTAAEMLSEVIAAAAEGDVNHVVLMGSGEPLDNYDQTVEFIRRLCVDLGLSRRHIALSTCGLCEAMDRLSREQYAPVLTVSLHAPDAELRKRIMPIALRYSVKQVVAAAKRYFEATSRRVIFEYSLIDGFNDTIECAKKLAAQLKGFPCHVNLIRLNPVKERGLAGSDKTAVKTFSDALTAMGVSNTVRRTLGADIDGACGQLRRKYLGGEP